MYAVDSKIIAESELNKDNGLQKDLNKVGVGRRFDYLGVIGSLLVADVHNLAFSFTK